MNTARLCSRHLGGCLLDCHRLFALGLLCLLLAVASDAFLDAEQYPQRAAPASLPFLLASGVTLVILTGGLDLSVGANGRCRPGGGHRDEGHGVDPRRRGRGLGTGALIGLANGLLVAMLRILPFHCHLRHVVGAARRHLLVHGGRDHPWLPPAFRAIGSGYCWVC
ncbi:hypothetical protein ACU4GD_22495 [Cupriavidus basilensis]